MEFRTTPSLGTTIGRGFLSLGDSSQVAAVLGATSYPQPFLSWNMDSNPGWTISGGQWAYGHPTGGGGNNGNPDPVGGYTGNNVIGVNLSGDYTVTVGGPYYVTTPAIDCTQYTNVTLDFERWLNTDWGSYVGATIDVWDGKAWHNIYSIPTTPRPSTQPGSI